MMRIFTTYILMAISFSLFGQIEKTITNPELLVKSSNIKFKHFKDVQVFQYFDNDSLNGRITYSEKLDSNGNVIAEYYKDYKTDKGNGRADVLIIKEYNKKNQLIISTSYYETFKKGEVQKSFFYYNNSLLVQIETFELKRRLKPNLDKGLGRPGGDIIHDKDFEKYPTWEIYQILIYEYDSIGRKKLSYSPVFQSSHNRFEYKYDSNGNLIEEKSLDESRLLYTIKYEYTGNQIISNLQWANSDWEGTKKIKIKDENGRLRKEVTIQGDKEWLDLYNYDKEGKINRFMSFDSDGKLSLTHIYKYKNKCR